MLELGGAPGPGFDVWRALLVNFEVVGHKQERGLGRDAGAQRDPTSIIIKGFALPCDQQTVVNAGGDVDEARARRLRRVALFLSIDATAAVPPRTTVVLKLSVSLFLDQ